MINAMDAEEKKLFLKEVTLLSGLNHPNVVKFMSVCHQPPAMMLEYVYFDFRRGKFLKKLWCCVGGRV